MITINIDPVLLRIGHFAIRWYGVMIALGVLAALQVALSEARRKGIPEDHIYSGSAWAILGGLLGARLFHVVDNWSYYATRPGEILTLQQSGLAVYGAIFGGVIAVLVFAIWRRLSFWRLADTAAFGVPLGQAIGRVGCLINGCNYGLPTTLPWGVVWTSPEAMVPATGVAYHPAQAYDLLWALAVFGLLWGLRARFRVDGQAFLAYIALYSAGRFWISFLREDNLVLLGLRQAQAIALLSLVVAVPLIIWLNRRRMRLSAHAM